MPKQIGFIQLEGCARVDENDAAADARAIVETIARAAAQVDSEDVEQRRGAVGELYDLCRKVGTRARAALPLLLESLADADDGVGESALYGLRYCAPDSIEPLIDCLSSPDPLVRRRACASLGNIGDPAFAACDMLRALLKDPVQEVRSPAAWALGLIHDTSNRTIAALFAMMRSGTAKDRSSALHALGNLGKALTDVGPLQANQHEIIEALEDRHDDVRWGACYVLESLALEPSKHMELLARHLADRSERVRSSAIGQMKGLAGKVDLARHIEPMCAVVCGGGHSAREMCEVLALLGPSARPAVPALIEALRSDHPSVVVEAAKALWKIDRRADEALPHLARLFDDIVDAESACDAICEIGPAAAPLIDSVIQALQSDSWDLQWAAADALGQMASGDPHVVAALATALGHASHIVCSAAVAALAQIGEPALPALSDILERPDDDRAEWAADALGRMGYSAKSAVDLLRSTLRSPRVGLAAWSAIALAKIAGDVTAIPTLISLLGRSDRADLRQQAAIGLKTIGPPAASAVRTLLSVRDDRDASVRMAVDQALSAVSARRH